MTIDEMKANPGKIPTVEITVDGKWYIGKVRWTKRMKYPVVVIAPDSDAFHFTWAAIDRAVNQGEVLYG